MNTYPNKKQQYFYEEIKARFYLRKPKSKRPTRIFLVVYISGKQHRYPTQVRVYPSQWNSKKQLAVVSNVQSEQDNHNNKIVNEHLITVRRYFSEFIEYICNNDVTDIAKTLKQFIYRDMAKSKKNSRKNIYDVIPNALEHYHKYVKPSIKDSTKRQNESLLSEFRRFLDTLPSKERTMQIFSQRGLNKYKQYLIDKMERSKNDDKMRNFGVGQLNRCGAIIALLINRVLVEKEDGINPVVWNKVDDPRREDQIGHIPLLDNEVIAIENCLGLTDVEEEYRNLFLLQLECGQRVSDMAKILTGKYNVEQGKKYKYIVLSTIKENIKAYVPLTPRMTMLIERVKAHKLVDPIEFEEKTKGKGNGTYNEAIRRISKKAELDREIVKINASQIEVRKPLYETITSHDARCTFITNMIKKGVSPERLCKMTGHASDEMIKRVYAQLSDTDEINRIESDLYSDVDENGKQEREQTDKLFELKTDNRNDGFAEEVAATPIIKNVADFDLTEQFDQDNYVNGLNVAIDEAINDGDQIIKFFNNPLLGIFRSKYEKFYDSIKAPLEKKGPDSKEKVFFYWDRLNNIFDKECNELPEKERSFVALNKYISLLAFMDYCKEKHIGDETVEHFEGLCRELCEENSAPFFVVTMLLQSKVLFPSLYIAFVCGTAWMYVLYNRPYVDDIFSNKYKSVVTLNRIPDWSLVLRELHTLPAMKLQILINKTDCPYDVKADLYNSVVSDDLLLFSNTIKMYERETYELVTFSYVLNELNKIMQFKKSKLQSNGKWLNLNPLELLTHIQNISFQSPFKETSFNFMGSSGYADVLGFDIHNLGNKIDIKGLTLKILDVSFLRLNDLKKRAYPSEIKLYNNVLKLIEKFPDVKKAYTEYKNEKDSLIGSGSATEDSKKNLNKEMPEVAFQDLEIFKTETTISELEPKELLSTLKMEIIKRGDDTFKEFVNFLVLSNCIDDSDAVKQLLVYRFTGKCRPKGDLEKIPWNPDKLRELAYIIMYSTVRAYRKYDKVREFFEGPKFPDDISMIRTYADSAPQDFRLGLNKLYPDVFTIKGAR